MNPNKIELAFRTMMDNDKDLQERINRFRKIDQPDELVEHRPAPDRYLRERTGKLSPERATLQGIKRRAALNLLMLPGEIMLKEFVAMQAKKFKQSESCIRSWIDRGQMKLKLRRINQRVVFVMPT